MDQYQNAIIIIMIELFMQVVLTKTQAGLQSILRQGTLWTIPSRSTREGIGDGR